MWKLLLVFVYLFPGPVAIHKMLRNMFCWLEGVALFNVPVPLEDMFRTCFMSGGRPRCLIIVSTAYSFLPAAHCSSVLWRDVGTIGPSLICSLVDGCRANGALATRSNDRVCRLPFSSIVIVFLWTLFIPYGPLAHIGACWRCLFLWPPLKHWLLFAKVEHSRTRMILV